jgi:hypothetical protein
MTRCRRVVLLDAARSAPNYRWPGKARFCDDHHSGSVTAALNLSRHSKGRSAMTPELILLAVGFMLSMAGIFSAANYILLDYLVGQKQGL